MSATNDDLMDTVGEILQEVSEEVIEPRFDALHEADVRSKPPGELVTVADEEAEGLLKTRLSQLIPGTVFVGEEEFSGDAGLSEALHNEHVWLVDPLDGTANFVSGSPLWAVMVALVWAGETRAAWIWQPAAKVMYQAELGAGATRDGVPIVRDQCSFTLQIYGDPSSPSSSTHRLRIEWIRIVTALHPSALGPRRLALTIRC